MKYILKLLPVFSLLVTVSCNLSLFKEDTKTKLYSRLDALGVTKASISIYSNKGPIWTKSYGGANNETIFKLASLSKIITGIAIMQLHEKKLIDINTNINEYLPFEVINQHHPETLITTSMLLNHTSGIKDNWSVITQNLRSYDLNQNPIPGLLETCKEYLSTEGKLYDKNENYFSFNPGDKVEYSNMGYALLGLLVQCVSDLDFKDYCQTYIFSPLDIKGGWNLFPEDTNDMAIPTDFKGKAVSSYVDALYPAGFFSCSSNDFANLMSIFLDNTNTVLKDETVSFILSRKIADQYYIFKESNFTVNSENLIYHLGGLDGSRTSVFLSKKHNVGFVLLSSGEYDMPMTFYEIVKILIDYGRKIK